MDRRKWFLVMKDLDIYLNEISCEILSVYEILTFRFCKLYLWRGTYRIWLSGVLLYLIINSYLLTLSEISQSLVYTSDNTGT